MLLFIVKYLLIYRLDHMVADTAKYFHNEALGASWYDAKITLTEP